MPFIFKNNSSLINLSCNWSYVETVFIYVKVATLKLKKARSLVVNFFCFMFDWQKVFFFISSQDHIQRQIFTIANIWCTTSRISTCTELEVRFCWLKLRCFDIHYTTTVPEMELFFNSFDEVGSWFLDDVVCGCWRCWDKVETKDKYFSFKWWYVWEKRFLMALFLIVADKLLIVADKLLIADSWMIIKRIMTIRGKESGQTEMVLYARRIWLLEGYRR